MRRAVFFILLVVISGKTAAAQFSRTGNFEVRRLSMLQRLVEPLYRKPTEKELKAVEPSRELFEKYAQFLRQPGTGLTKLIDDKGCAENTKIVVANDNCLKYTMPGAGSSFSFRTRNYRIPRLADLTFTNKSFQSAGILTHGIFVNLGDVPVEEVTLRAKGMKYLTDFQPEPDYEKSKAIDAQLIEGVQQDGFLYRRGLYTVENTTFALRSVAYDGKYFRAVGRVTYNEFDYDKRKDVIVVFRIVERDAEGGVTILWKILQEKGSPDIKRRMTEAIK